VKKGIRNSRFARDRTAWADAGAGSRCLGTQTFRPDFSILVFGAEVKKLLWPASICFLFLSCSSAPQPKAVPIQVVQLLELDNIIKEHQGKGLLLNFWAIWCGPCVEELPALMEIAREYSGQGGAVLGVSYDLMVPAVTREGIVSQMHDFVREHRLDIPVLIFDGPDYDAINEKFGMPGPIPYTLAIDRSGAIVDRHDGQAGKNRFAEMMRKALGK